MANLFSPEEDRRRLPGTSGAELTDLNPEQAYDTDLRRVDEEERSAAESVNDKQARVAKFMRAAKTAGAYKQRAGIDEPMIRGRTPIGKASINGVELPSQRDENYGRPGAGGTNYARKPQPNFGRPFG
ncbi:MAG: hypothetical protein ACO24H_10245 [Polynucleobacter sp.]|jgi:hypothetical protein